MVLWAEGNSIDNHELEFLVYLLWKYMMSIQRDDDDLSFTVPAFEHPLLSGILVYPECRLGPTNHTPMIVPFHDIDRPLLQGFLRSCLDSPLLSPDLGLMFSALGFGHWLDDRKDLRSSIACATSFKPS